MLLTAISCFACMHYEQWQAKASNYLILCLLSEAWMPAEAGKQPDMPVMRLHTKMYRHCNGHTCHQTALGRVGPLPCVSAHMALSQTTKQLKYASFSICGTPGAFRETQFIKFILSIHAQAETCHVSCRLLNHQFHCCQLPDAGAIGHAKGSKVVCEELHNMMVKVKTMMAGHHVAQ